MPAFLILARTQGSGSLRIASKIGLDQLDPVRAAKREQIVVEIITGIVQVARTQAMAGVPVRAIAVSDEHVRARLLQEEMAAELADESNRSLKAMAVMSALLLPGTLVVGIFGMNTAGLPFTHGDAGFFWAMFVGIAATVLFYWLLRRAGVSMRF